MTKWIVTGFWLLLIIIVCWFSIDRLPPQHNPFTPLSIDHPLGLATRTKLSQLKKPADACYAFLSDSKIEYTRLTDSEAGQNCGFYDAVVLDKSLLPYSTTLEMTCPLTSAVAVWERQSVVLRSKQFFDFPVVKVLSFGSYSCRRMYGRKEGKFSEHATANAIDIKGFELSNGKRITVLKDWGKDTPEGKFPKSIQTDACKVFGTVLGPDYNKAHADHFHFDMSQTGVCE